MSVCDAGELWLWGAAQNSAALLLALVTLLAAQLWEHTWRPPCSTVRWMLWNTVKEMWLFLSGKCFLREKLARYQVAEKTLFFQDLFSVTSESAAVVVTICSPSIQLHTSSLISPQARMLLSGLCDQWLHGRLLECSIETLQSVNSIWFICAMSAALR